MQIIVLEDKEEYMGYDDGETLKEQDRRPFHLLVCLCLSSSPMLFNAKTGENYSIQFHTFSLGIVIGIFIQIC